MSAWTSAVTRAVVVGAVLVAAHAGAQVTSYPATRKIDHMDDYHGTKVADPYRWLEDETSPETAAWIEAQNAVTFPYLEKIPFRNALLERVTQLVDYERYSVPSRKGPYFFFSKNSGLQNQSVLFLQKGLDAQSEVLIDPNAWSADGTVQLAAFEPSKDAKYAVYGTSQSGSDWQQYKVMELASKRTLPDTIDWVKVSDIAWHGDGFYYSRYPEPPAGHEKASINENHQVFFHRLGTVQTADALVYEDLANPQRFHTVNTTEDERFAILYVSDRGKGKDGNALYVRDLAGGSRDFTPLISEITNDSYNVVDNAGEKLLVATNHGAPNWRVVLIDPKNPAEANWRLVLAERPETLERATVAGGKLFASYLKDVTSRVYVHALDGKLENEIALAGPGSASGFAGPKDAAFVFYTFNSLSEPPTIYRYDIATKVSSVFRAPKVPGYDAAQFETKQVFYPSKDGTRVPMFLVYRKGLKLDGNNPTLLYGYGGFNIVLSPDVQRGAYGAARAGSRLRVGEPARRRRVRREVARGGHQAEEAERIRRLHRRRRVADREQVHVAGQARDPGRIERRTARGRGHDPAAGAIPRRDPAGGRHGHAALPQVHDRLELGGRLRLERRTRTSSRRCTPTRRCTTSRPGVKYPATLITTADHDDRVVPAHSFKYAATLQAMASRDSPVLIRIETKSGHGASNLTKQLETTADIDAFVMYNLGVTPQPVARH